MMNDLENWRTVPIKLPLKIKAIRDIFILLFCCFNRAFIKAKEIGRWRDVLNEFLRQLGEAKIHLVFNSKRQRVN